MFIDTLLAADAIYCTKKLYVYLNNRVTIIRREIIVNMVIES